MGRVMTVLIVETSLEGVKQERIKTGREMIYFFLSKEGGVLSQKPIRANLVVTLLSK